MKTYRFGDFGDRNGVSSLAGGGPNIRPGLSGLPACVGTSQLLRLPLYIVTSVQRLSIRARGAVRHQSVFRERGRAGGASLPAAIRDTGRMPP